MDSLHQRGAHCRPSDETGSAATHLYFQPLEEFLDKTRSLAMAAHHALGAPRGRPEPLCKAVYERLVRDGGVPSQGAQNS